MSRRLDSPQPRPASAVHAGDARASIHALADYLRRDPAFADALCHERSLPSRTAVTGPLPRGFDTLRPLLDGRGIAHLYAHQIRALERLDKGHHVVLATPTASGKTLVYNAPVLAHALREPEVRALYLFPLRALEQDQRQRLESDIARLGGAGERPSVAVYDGDTKPHARRRIREQPPNVLISTPDMLHAGILPNHVSWEGFFRHLHYVVLDELHAYRGVCGSHVAQVLRRLRRVSAFHGSRPRFVAASATIANPGELATGLTGEPFEVIREDGAPRPERRVMLFNPRGSPYTAAARLFRAAVRRGLRTIAFTKARRITELMHAWVVDADPGLASRISSYRAGFLPEERREIEARLFRGELAGVISTSALEMGIDVGDLDVCILVGYPGSQIAMWQRAGRVGRSREALVALIAQPDALDQYLASHPEMLFEREFEHAVVDPRNEELLAGHLPCAAAEVPLREGEPWLEEPRMPERIARLEEDGTLLRSATGREWFTARRRPHRDVDLRQLGSSYTIELEGREGRARVIGSSGAGRVFAECHAGAIYLHRARQYRVRRLDIETRRVEVEPVDVAYYTRALSDKETTILDRTRTRPAGAFRLVEGRVRVTTRMKSYERRRVHGQDLLGSEPLDLPPSSFETTGIWLEMPDEIEVAVKSEGRHLMGGIHAIEHAALSLFPLFALCDRLDVAGISYARHPQTGGPAVFLYDAQPGGLGLAASLFDRAETLLEATLEMIDDCPCDAGCPACVHSPKCSNGNRPIDKPAAIQVLHLLLGHDPLPCVERPEHSTLRPSQPDQADAVEAAASEPPPPRLVYLDLETQRSAEEVGGWHNAHLMRVALAVVYDSCEERFTTYHEAEVPALLDHLARADLVVGFNIARFDYSVLRGYATESLGGLPTFDLLDAVRARIGFRLSLAHLAEETLGAEKQADGLQSLAWWREGRVAEIETYCRRDVELVRDLFAHACREGHLLFRTRGGQRVRIPTPWSRAEILESVRAEAGTPAPPRRRAQ